jgi:type IV pilus assembly protein PilA
MLRNLRERAQAEKGFTLIELLVVILIIGILAAIAIPSFLNQRQKGTDAEAKTQSTTASQAMETCATDNDGSYANCNKSAILLIEPTLGDAGSRLTVSGNTASAYTVDVTTNDSRGQHYQISKSGGTTTRSCTGSLGGGCKSGGTW